MLTAQAGVAVFRVAFERWVSQSGRQDLPQLIRDSLDLTAVTGGDGGVAQAVDMSAVLVIAAGLILVAGIALAAETVVLRRMRLSSAVRIGGDQGSGR